MSIAKFSVKNPIIINMIMVLVFLVGINTVNEIPKENMPPVDFGSFLIIVMYPGVSPTEIEQLVVSKIEDEISDIDDIDFISSTASEGRAIISVQMLPNADIDQSWNDLNAELDKVNGLPEDAEDPFVMRLNMREVNPICSVTLSGELSGNSFREIADDLREGLLNLDYVGKVDINGTQEREIWVEGDIKKLDEYGLTLDALSSSIKFRNMNIPGGNIRFGSSDYIIRSMGEYNSLTELKEQPVLTDSEGKTIRLKDVAVVKDTLAKSIINTRINKEKSVTLFAYKKADGNIIAVMEDIKKYVDTFSKGVTGLKTTIRNDTSEDVRSSVNTLGSSALLGVLLVFVVLFIFLGWRNAFFAAIGIPFSFLLAFILMDYFDITMNNLSLFALVLVLGMVVDDAIVVIENVHRYVELGYSNAEAAIRGAKEVMWPVISAVTTTCVAFMPMLMMEGMMGKFMRVFPIVVTLSLLASLFECLIVLPSHLAEHGPAHKNKKGKEATEKAKEESREFTSETQNHEQEEAEFNLIESEAEELKHKREMLDEVDSLPDNHLGQINEVDHLPFFRGMLDFYQKAIKFSLKHRILSVAVILTAFILSFMALAFRLVQFEFFPTPDPQTIVLRSAVPVGTHLDETDKTAKAIENYILEEMPEHQDIEAVVTMVGTAIKNHRSDIMSSNMEFRIDLVDDDKLTHNHEEIKASIRKFMKQRPEISSYEFDIVSDGPPTGKDIEIRIKGDNLKRLEYIGDLIKGELNKIPGVADVDDSFTPGKKEVQIIPDYDKLHLYGLTTADVAGFIRTASYGTTVSKYRGGGVEEYDIIVKMKEDQIDKLDELKNLKIRSRNGSLIFLKDIVSLNITSGLSQINHWDKKRIITITGNCTLYDEPGKPQKAKRTTDEVMRTMFTGDNAVFKNFDKRFPGYRIDLGGVVEEQAKSYQSLYRAFMVAIILIFAILAAQFKSYVQPFIVMTTIPFSFIGVIFGLIVTGLPFSLGTLVAVVALSGIVVNDSLVLVDFINKERERGVDRWNSLINGGMTRLRPILLTTITTIIGLMPMLLSTSRSAAEWKPIAVSIAFGLAFATVLTLFVIPVIYSLTDSFFGKLRMTRFKTHLSYKEAMRKREILEKKRFAK